MRRTNACVVFSISCSSHKQRYFFGEDCRKISILWAHLGNLARCFPAGGHNTGIHIDIQGSVLTDAVPLGAGPYGHMAIDLA